MSARPAPNQCSVCRKERADLQPWQRRLPSHDRLQVCTDCTGRLRRIADGRGPEESELMHMNQLQSRLGGEVWTTEATAYWFRAPFLHREPTRLADLLDRQRVEFMQTATPPRPSVRAVARKVRAAKRSARPRSRAA